MFGGRAYLILGVAASWFVEMELKWDEEEGSRSILPSLYIQSLQNRQSP